MSEQNTKLETLGRFLQPSWLSGLTSLAASIAVAVGTLIFTNYSGSSLRYIVDTQRDKARGPINYEPLQESFSGSQLISDIPLLIFWMGVGLMAYWFVTSMIKALSSVVELEHEMDYVHVDKHTLIREAFLRLGIRIAVLIVWALYLLLTLHVLLPYVMALALAAKTVSLIAAVLYIMAAILVFTGVLHAHVVLARAFVLRTRVLSPQLA